MCALYLVELKLIYTHNLSFLILCLLALLLGDDLRPPLGHNLGKVKDTVGALLDSSLFGDDRVDERGGSHVKGWVPDVDALVGRGHARLGRLVDGAVGLDDGACDLRQLLSLALLNLDAVACCCLEVDAGRRCGHDELDAVLLGEDSQLVRANLVGRVAVADDAVGAHNDGGNVHLGAARAKQRSCHRVGDQRRRDLFVDELKRRQAATLVVRSGLGAERVLEDLLVAERADDTQRRAMARCCQRARIAVRQDGHGLLGRGARLGSQPLGAVLANGLVRLEVLFKDALSLLDKCRDDRFLASAGSADGGLELVDGVCQVDGGRPAGLEVVEGFVDASNDFSGSVASDRPVVKLYGESQSGNNGNGGGASDAHRVDAVPGLGTVGDDIVVRFVGQAELVEDLQLAAGVADGLQSRHVVGLVASCWRKRKDAQGKKLAMLPLHEILPPRSLGR